MKEDQIKGMIESKRLIALELRKKRNLAKLQSEKCTDAMKRLVQGLVVGVRDSSVEQAEDMENIVLVDIVQWEEVLLALRNFWIVDYMDIETDDCESNGVDQEMVDLTFGEIPTESEIQMGIDLEVL